MVHRSAPAEGPGRTCTRCGRHSPWTDPAWACHCGGLLDLPPPAGPPGVDGDACPTPLWPRLSALGVPGPPVSLGEVVTPLVALAPDLHLKLEHLLPTHSFKDRGAAVVVARALACGATSLVVDSSGNAGAALSAYAARAGLPCEVFVPAHTSPGKMAQARAHGATVIPVPGPREAAADAAAAAAHRGGRFYASHVHDPAFLLGTSTFAYEVAEQLGRMPRTVVLPAGNGTLVLGAARGFAHLAASGWGATPRLIAVQAATCAPLRSQPGELPRTPRPTSAEGIAVAQPLRGDQVRAALRSSGGRVVVVEEREIAEAGRELAARGWWVEPTAAATWAGYLRVAGEAPDAVVPLCGTGLKSA